MHSLRKHPPVDHELERFGRQAVVPHQLSPLIQALESTGGPHSDVNPLAALGELDQVRRRLGEINLADENDIRLLADDPADFLCLLLGRGGGSELVLRDPFQILISVPLQRVDVREKRIVCRG